MNSIPFDSLQSRRALDIKEFQRHKETHVKKNDDFYSICQKVKEHIYSVYDKKIEQKANGQTKEDFASLYHTAMKGNPSSVNLIKKHIEEYIVEHGLRGSDFPSYYKSLVDGIFEEEFGWGPLSVFKQETNEAAQVLGKEIKIKRDWGWELQPFQFKSLDKVMELAYRFSNMSARTILNAHNTPEIETMTHDNIRVSIMIPDRMYAEPVITLRKKVVERVTFDSMVGYNTFPKEALPIFEGLARFKVNSVIAGPPGCGKSTMLHAFLHHQLYEYRMGKKIPERTNTVYAESSPEWDIRLMNPNSNVLHLIGRGEEFENRVAASLLRHDISRVVLGEIREHEVGLYKRGSKQGIKQLMGTLHDMDPEDIPEILTELYLQYYPSSSSLTYKNVQYSFARNLHFSVSMDEFLMEGTEASNDKLVKRVTGIHIYDVNKENKEVIMHTIMRYHPETDSWSYSKELPERFVRLATRYERKNFTQFLETLQQLASMYPSKEESYEPTSPVFI